MNRINNRNHRASTRHRNQSWLGIFLPIALAVLAVIALAVLLSLQPTGGGTVLGNAAAISEIWLISVCCGITLIPLGLVIAAVIGTGTLQSHAKPTLQRAQDFTNKTRAGVGKLSAGVRRPRTALQSLFGELKTWLESMIGRLAK